jgi:recombination protein RecR
MTGIPKPIDDSAKQLRSFPGVGKRSAQKLALDILGLDKEEYKTLISTLDTMRSEVRLCPVTGIFTSSAVSEMLSDNSLNQRQICVVETPVDVFTIQKAEIYRGTFQSLGRLLSPLDNIFASDTSLPLLFDRITKLLDQKDTPIEIIFFLKNGFAADATIAYIQEWVSNNNLQTRINMTKLAQGLPLYFNVDYLDQATLEHAFNDRKTIKLL